MVEKKKKLNLGCGNDYKEGWVNLDIDRNVGADVIFDLRKISKGKKLPFKSKTFDLIWCSHVLEHFFDPTPLLEEMKRVCKVRGIIEVRVPYGLAGLRNLDHKKLFCLGSFEGKNFSFSNQASEEEVRLIYQKLYTPPTSKTFLGYSRKYTYWVFLGIINYLIKRSSAFYDDTILKNIFPNTHIHVKYVRVG